MLHNSKFFDAFQLFAFADKYRGRYDASITVARNYYGSFSGYGVSNSETSWCAVSVHTSDQW